MDFSNKSNSFIIVGFAFIGLLFLYDFLFEEPRDAMVLPTNQPVIIVNENKDPTSEEDLALIKLLRGSNLNLSSIPQVFAPGTLQIPAVEALRQCYFDPTVWRSHRGKYQCVISDEAQLVYYHVPKSGSSTNRRAFRGRFEGKDGSVYCDSKQPDRVLAYRQFTAVREPLDRFYSQFMEAEWRANKSGNGEMTRMDIWKIKNEEERFEAYVNHWHQNGFGHLMDTHLRLQSAMFTWPDGSIRPLDWVVKMETINEDWRTLSAFFNKEWEDMETARKNYHRALNDSAVSDETKRKVCQVVAHDYCCLNYKLPKVCEGAVWCTYKARLPLREDALRHIEPLLPDLNNPSQDPPAN